MKIKEGFILRKMDDMSIVVAVGENAKSFNGVINLVNEPAEFIWKQLEKGCTKEELIEAMLAEYEAPREVIEEDVNRLLEKLQKENVLDE